MVTNQSYDKRMARGRPPRYLWRLGFLTFMTLLVATGMHAGDLKNKGKINNTGTIRIKNKAVGLPDTLKGTFELFGANQIVPGIVYQHLSLTGSGTDSASGNLYVTGTATVAPAVTLQIPSGSLMKLDSLSGRLTEQGYVSGHVQRTVVFDGSTPTSDFGGIGVSISWGGLSPGATVVDRFSGISVNAGGKTSIKRFITIKPAVDTSLNATMTFNYAADEIAGYNTNTFELWRSPDNGATWRRERSTVNQIQRTLSRTGIRSFGLWTVADGTNPLGISKYEWEADTMHLIAGNGQQQPARAWLPSPFMFKVTDAFGQPIANTPVTFAITKHPATDDSLSVVNGTTDQNGLVSTRLKLGSATGDYEVTAQVPGVANAVGKMLAKAGSMATQLRMFAGSGQSDTVRSVLKPFMAIAKDDSSRAVQGVTVQFAVISKPKNTIGDSLFKTSDTTDSTGIATTQLRFGNKSGTYWIEVTSTQVSGVANKDTFKVVAEAGTPQRVFVQGDLPTADTISTVLKPFIFRITDLDTNGVRGKTIQFAVSNKPQGSISDSLFTYSVNSNDTGYAQTQLRLGEKAGDYFVTASVPLHPGLSHKFMASAKNGRPSKMIGNPTPVPSDTIGAKIAPFAVTITDRADNPVYGLGVNFLVSSKPTGSKGDTVTVPRAQTDSAGTVKSQLVLGTKVGHYRVSVTADTLPGVFREFTADAKPGVIASFDTTKTYAETKPILTLLDSMFVIRVADRGDNPIFAEKVRFSIDSIPAKATGCSLSDTLAITDSLGLAKTKLMLGDKVGKYTVTATSAKLAGRSRQFTATALHGLASKVARVTSADTVIKPILQYLDTAFTVLVTDKGANPVPNVPVFFTVAEKPKLADSTKLSLDTAMTDAAGKASTLLRLGTKVGQYIVLAKSPALPSDTIRFTAKALHGTARQMLATSAIQDSADVGMQLNPFELAVYDIGLNPIPKLPVQFAVTKAPSGATQYGLSAVADTTDSLGRVSSAFTLGTVPGNYEVIAIAGEYARIKIAFKATFTLGDANRSGHIDIADLTTLIDAILGKIKLTGMDFARADLNHDGVIDLVDVVIMQRKLLTDTWVFNPDITTQKSVVANQPAVAVPSDVNAPSAAVTQTTPIPQRTVDTMSAYVAATTQSNFEFTGSSLRFTLKNDVAVKGVQIILKLTKPVNINKPDLVFPRASKMSAYVSSSNDTVRAILYNLANTPIDTGNGPIIRLDLKLDTSEVVSSSVIISSGNNIATYVPQANIQKVERLLPKDWVLYQNYPNPFNPSTTIRYDVPEVSGKVPHIAIQIFNILGQKVRTIERADKDAGTYEVVWDGRNEAGERVATGVYIYRLLAGDHTMAKKMILLK